MIAFDFAWPEDSEVADQSRYTLDVGQTSAISADDLLRLFGKYIYT